MATMNTQQRRTAVDDLLKYARDSAHELKSGFELSEVFGIQRTNDDDNIWRLVAGLEAMIHAELDELRRKMGVKLGGKSLSAEEQFLIDRATKNERLELLSLVNTHYIEHVSLDKLMEVYDRSDRSVQLYLREGRKIVAELIARHQPATASSSHQPALQQPDQSSDEPSRRRGLYPWSNNPVRNQHILLTKVRMYWVEDFLQNSLYGMGLIQLDKTYQSEAVTHPWEMIVQWPDQSRDRLTSSTQAIDVFDELDRELLILGEAGTGKTTTLLELTRDLVQRAEEDDEHPIPVVFHLASWVGQESLRVWLIDELVARYEVPRELGEQWIAKAHILPLLDGLDEVKPAHRMACVAAINAFHRDYYLKALVVCSRSVEYREIGVQLTLQGAVEIQRLTDTQIQSYLTGQGHTRTHLQQMLASDNELRDLVRTPLFLNIFMLTYGNTPSNHTVLFSSPEELRRQLFQTYVEQMLTRRTPDTRYTKQQTIMWLAWLARAMNSQTQSIFHLERMQGAWLPTEQEQRRFIRRAGLFRGIFVGVLSGSFVVLALFCAAIILMSPFTPAWLTFKLMLFCILIGAVLFGSILGHVSLSASDGRQAEPIEIVETLKLSPKSLRIPLTLGLFFGGMYSIGFGVGLGLAVGLSIALISCAPYLVGAELQERTKPNQGIWRSGWYACILGIISSVAFGIPIGFFMEYVGLVPHLIYAIPLGLPLAMLLFFFYGGEAFFKYWLLRWMLYRHHHIPWHYVDFLDFAAQRIFMRRIGGGYIFIHRLVQDYFATLDNKSSKEL